VIGLSLGFGSYNYVFYLLLTWLPRLAPGGRMVMVVGKNLGGDSLQRWLTEQGWPTERLASSKGFRVLETRRAETAPASSSGPPAGHRQP